jgi:hypothetical protein
MKVADIIRGVLDLLDGEDRPVHAQGTIVLGPKPDTVEINQVDDENELIRLKQIAGLIGSGNTEFSNSPEEKIAGIEAVIQSGDDVHHSKHPSDIRSDSVSMYPMYQSRP